MKEQFFEPGQPDKGMYIKRSRLFYILILSNLFTILIYWGITAGIKDRYLKTPTEVSVIVHNPLSEHEATTDSIEAWKEKKAWLQQIQDLNDSQLILQRKYDNLNRKFEQWKAGE